MELQGKWDPKMDCIMDHLRIVDTKVQNTIGNWPDGDLKEAAKQVYNNLGAITGTILYLCKTASNCSSQAIGALLRTEIDACVSVLAFCEDPEDRAVLYLNFANVLRYKFLLAREKCIYTSFALAQGGQRPQSTGMKESVKAFLSQFGACYIKHDLVKNKPATQVLGEALAKDNVHVFTHTWYGGSPSGVLARAKMEWVGKVLYTMLCSSVHSDVWAAELFADVQPSNPACLAVQLWGVGMYRFCEALKITLPSGQKGFLRKWCCQPLQDRPVP